jgi:hypothetical protein
MVCWSTVDGIIVSTVGAFSGVADRECRSTASLMSSSMASSSSDEYHKAGEGVTRRHDTPPNAVAAETRFTCNSPDGLEYACTYMDGDGDNGDVLSLPNASKKSGDRVLGRMPESTAPVRELAGAISPPQVSKSPSENSGDAPATKSWDTLGSLALTGPSVGDSQPSAGLDLTPSRTGGAAAPDADKFMCMSRNPDVNKSSSPPTPSGAT